MLFPPHQEIAKHSPGDQEKAAFKNVNQRTHSKTARGLQLSPARRRQDAIHKNVMRLNRYFFNDLLIKGHSTGCSAHSRQHLIIETMTTTQSASTQVKSYTRNQHKVQPVYPNLRALLGWFSNAEFALVQIPPQILNLTSDISPGLRREPR